MGVASGGSDPPGRCPGRRNLVEVHVKKKLVEEFAYPPRHNARRILVRVVLRHGRADFVTSGVRLQSAVTAAWRRFREARSIRAEYVDQPA